MKLILTMAISANGIIATKEGDEDFLSHVNWIQFVKHAKKVGCFIWGRKTYEKVIDWGDEYLSDIESVKKIIVSSSDIELKPGFDLSNSPEEALNTLEKNGFSETIITGGANLNSEFAQRGLIDEVILYINPSIQGDGIPVFKIANFQLSLQLISAEKIDDDIVKLHYRVQKKTK